MAEGFIDPYNRNPKSGSLSHPEWLQYYLCMRYMGEGDDIIPE
jgi:hypothetical protein